MKCEEVRSLLWSLYEGELPEPLSTEVRAHIDSCETCRREAHICQEVESALKPMPAVKAPGAATARVLASVRPIAAERRAERRRSAIAALVPSRAELRRRLVPMIPWAAAAAVILVLGLLGYLPDNNPGPITKTIATGEAAVKSSSVAAQCQSYYQQTVAGIGHAQKAVAGASGWLQISLLAVAAILAAVVLEERVLSRRVEQRVRAYLS